jgi:hypothetical protein
MGRASGVDRSGAPKPIAYASERGRAAWAACCRPRPNESRCNMRLRMRLLACGTLPVRSADDALLFGRVWPSKRRLLGVALPSRELRFPYFPPTYAGSPDDPPLGSARHRCWTRSRDVLHDRWVHYEASTTDAGATRASGHREPTSNGSRSAHGRLAKPRRVSAFYGRGARHGGT